jgi:hypothetical protein
MAQRFEVTARGRLQSVKNRVEIYDSRFSGSVTDLTAQRQFIIWNAGQQDGTGLAPIRPHEIELHLIDDGNLSVLTDAAEDDIRVEVYREDTGDIVFKGYIAPNQFEDSPYLPDYTSVRLTGSAGLPLLEDSKVDTLSWSGNSSVTMMKAIRTILNTLYPTSINIEVGTHWFPEGISSSNLLPLEYRRIEPNALRSPRPDGDWLTLYDALKELLRTNGLTIQQTRRSGGIVWWLSQWDAYKSNGHIDTWTVDPAGNSTYNGDQDVVVDLGTLINNNKIQREHRRRFERQRSSVTVTYDHPSADNFLIGSGFESSGGNWTIDDTNVQNAGVFDHKNFSKTPARTNNNEEFALIRYNSNGANGATVFPFKQGSIPIVRPDKNAFLRLSLAGWEDKLFTYRARIENNGTYFTDTKTSIRADTIKGDVELPVNPIDAPIPKGQRLPIRRSFDFRSFFRVTERADTGDELIKGGLEQDIETPVELHYIKPVGSQDSIALNVFTKGETRDGKLGNRKNWRRWSVSVPAQDENGDSLPSATMSLELGVKKVDLGNGDLNWYFDNVRLQPIKGGQVLDQTVSEAADGDIGEKEEIDTIIGSGPTTNTVSRIILGPRWGIGASPSPVYPISELHARQRLRYFRGQLERLEVNPLRDQSNDPLIGHETADINGTIYRVVASETTPSDADNIVTLLEHNDFGT